MRHLVFASDGSLGTLLGIRCVIAQLESIGLTRSAGWAVWLVAPRAPASARTAWQLLFRGINFELVLAPSRDGDPYYVQLGLARVFERIAPTDSLVYLDYDHLVFRPTVLPEMLARDAVFVSSEYRPATVTLESLDHHVNISTIYGTGANLRNIGREWATAYDDIRSRVDTRYRTEYAFGLAASRAQVLLQPCSADVQGNFFVSSPASALFHFGGESLQSREMKALLGKVAASSELDAPELIEGVVRGLSRLLASAPG